MLRWLQNAGGPAAAQVSTILSFARTVGATRLPIHSIA